ncbi:MAG: hypothetical protein HFG00_06590 [Oscillibacter sp.]|nr:hypothetical protein [Oscillibacter sp.]
MDKFPVLLDGRMTGGELVLEPEGLYACFTVRCPLPDGLWCAWAVGEQGELRLGVLEPLGGQGTIRRRVSRRTAAPLGRIRQGEIRPLDAPPPEVWEPVPEPEQLFCSPGLRQRLKGLPGVLSRKTEDRRFVAIPYDRSRPFPLVPLFCFASLGKIGEKSYLLFCFDGEERPVFPN